MFKEIKQKILTPLIFFVLLTLVFKSSIAIAPKIKAIPVGGFIKHYQICTKPIYHINISTIVGKTGKETGAGFWSYIPKTTFLYNYGPPKRRGQAILGLANPHYMPCLSEDPSPKKIGPGGQVILFLGSTPI